MKILLLLLTVSVVMAQAQAPHIDSSYSDGQIQAFLKDGFERNDRLLQAKAYYLLAAREQNGGINNEYTITYLQKSHELFAASRDAYHLHRAKLALALSYVDQKTFDQAFDLQREALTYFEQRNDLFMATHAAASLANTYKLMGNLPQERVYLERCETNNKLLKDNILSLAILNSKVVNFQRQRQYDQALSAAHQLLTIARASKKTNFEIAGLFFEGILHQFKGQYQTAIGKLFDCLSLISNPNLSPEAMQCYLHLSQCYEALHDYPHAYQYSQRYGQASHAILNNQRQTALQRQTLRFDAEGKRRQIANLEKEKREAEQTALWQRTITIGIGIAAFVLFCALFSVLYFHRQKTRSDQIIENQKEEIKQKEINELRQELTLQNVQAIVTGQETERERIAKDLHDSLGGMLSTVRLRFDALKTGQPTHAYEQALDMLDNTIREVRHIAHNLQPDALLQFGLTAAINDLVNRTHSPATPDINFQTYGQEFALTPTQSLTIFRIIQELLYNAIKHAKASEILVQLNWQTPSLMILVEDDGVGYDTTQIQTGMGTKNIQTRVAYLNAHLEVQSVPDEGTTVVVTVGV
ncbi:MAG: hypothetical protein EAZ91_02150 [Cytophagales bacterium]|nr:MAG: hypothetical protein EAZ91_02150 [Cytophagales bacterium]